MNKIILAALFVGLMVSVSEAGRRGGVIARGDNYTTTTSSAQIFEGSGTLYKLILEHGNGTDYVVPVATSALEGAAFASYEAAMIAAPNVVFPSTASFSGGTHSQPTLDFGPEGIRLQNGLYLWISAVGNRVTATWRR